MSHRHSFAAKLATTALVVAAATIGGSVQADEVDACLTAAERAQGLRRQSNLVEARAQLQVCSQDVCPKVVKSDCKTWLAEVEASVPSLVVKAVDPAGRELRDVHVFVDGKAQPKAGERIELNPGDHVLRCERDGSEPRETRVIVRPGEHDRVIPVTLTPVSSPAREPVAPVPSAAPSNEPAPKSTDEAKANPASKPTSAHPVPVVAWVLGGVGVAALGATAVFWTLGMSERSDLYSGCGASHNCNQSSIDSSHTKLVIGDVVGVVGLAALGAAVGVTLVTWKNQSTAQLHVEPTTGGGLATLRARF